MININSRGKEEVEIGKIDLYRDGHPHIHNIHNNKIVFDTYPDKARMKNLFLYDYENDGANFLKVLLFTMKQDVPLSTV